MDAGLAKLMNSSVGTSALKALDTILKTDNTTIATNAADKLFNSFKNSAKLVGSDEVMYNYTGTWSYGYGNQVQGGFGESDYAYIANSFIKFDTSGTVIIKTLQTARSSTYVGTYYLRVIDDKGVTIGTSSAYVPVDAEVEISYSLNVTAGAKYKIVLAGSSHNSPDDNFVVCGKTMLLGATVTLTS